MARCDREDEAIRMLFHARDSQRQRAARERAHRAHTCRNPMDTEWPDAIGKMKQFACYFTHGVPNGSELRGNVHTARTPAEILDRVDSFFADAVNVGGVS